MSNTVHCVSTGGTAGVFSAGDQLGHGFGRAGRARWARQTNIRPFNLLPVHPVARRLGALSWRVRHAMTFQAMTQDNRFWISNLLSRVSRADTRSARSDLQSGGRHGRSGPMNAGASPGWRTILLTNRPVDWQAAKSKSSIGRDGPEYPFAGNAGKHADTDSNSCDMSLMNTIGLQERNGCVSPVRFMPTASQRLRWNER